MACENEDYSDLLQQCEGIPLNALRMSVINKLCKYLDVEGSIHGDLCNNYTALAELAGFCCVEILMFQEHRSPTKELLLAWCYRPDLNPTCDNLVKYLIQLDRKDILTDCRELFVF